MLSPDLTHLNATDVLTSQDFNFRTPSPPANGQHGFLGGDDNLKQRFYSSSNNLSYLSSKQSD